ncbi:hypothetical protein ACVIJ6_003192 [Bradyrhizobium sp. USDA 4369]
MPGNWHVRFGERRAETSRREAVWRCTPTLPVCVSSPRPPRPRWRSTGRRRSATHPKGWSAAEDAVVATFLPREEWALAQGKKVVSTALRLRRSRRSRSSARSSHQRGHVRRVLNHKSERRWRASVRLGKRSKRFSVGKETKEEKGRYRQYKANRERTAPAPHLWAPDAITAILSKCCEEGRDYLSLKLDDPSACCCSRQVRHADGTGSLLMRCG